MHLSNQGRLSGIDKVLVEGAPNSAAFQIRIHPREWRRHTISSTLQFYRKNKRAVLTSRSPAPTARKAPACRISAPARRVPALRPHNRRAASATYPRRGARGGASATTG